MKKKGLIVATIVMVLVLAVSLTTATYAWFTNEGSATVDPINFSVQSASDVMIGVSTTNAYDGTKTLTNFVSGDTTFTAGAWDGDSGLGLHISPNVTLAMEQAIYSFNGVSSGNHTSVYFATDDGTGDGAKLGSDWAEDYTVTVGGSFSSGTYYVKQDSSAGSAITAYLTSETPYMVGTVDTYDTASAEGVQTANTADQITTGISFASGHQILKASGEENVITTGSLTSAAAQSDYVNIAFGALASNPNLLGYGMVVYVRPNDSKSTLGLNAAIHVAYNLDNAGWVEYDLYGTNDRNTVKANMDVPGLPSFTSTAGTHTYTAATGSVLADRQAGDAYIYIPFYHSTNGTTTAGTQAADMHQVQLVVYLCGPDVDCVTASTGVSALLTIEFISLQKS